MSDEPSPPGRAVEGQAAPVDPATSLLYEDFLGEQIAAEERRKDTVEQRGLAVITTSGSLVTLLFGLSTYLPRDSRFAVPATARGLLTTAMVGFLLACVLALATNVPLPYGRLDAAALDLPGLVREPEPTARQRVLITRWRLLAGTQHLNDTKAKLLVAAIAAEVLGAVCVALTVASVLQQG